MDTEVRIAALEQLLVALLRASFSAGIDVMSAKKAAQAALMGSDGPGGPSQKVEACEHIERLLS